MTEAPNRTRAVVKFKRGGIEPRVCGRTHPKQRGADLSSHAPRDEQALRIARRHGELASQIAARQLVGSRIGRALRRAEDRLSDLRAAIEAEADGC